MTGESLGLFNRRSVRVDMSLHFAVKNFNADTKFRMENFLSNNAVTESIQ